MTFTGTAGTTASPTPSTSMSTAFTLSIPSTQQANADTLIRGYVSNYAAQAGYSNAVVNSVTWANGAYTVTGNVVNAQQFQNGFPLSSAYTNLIASLAPSATPAPSTAPSIALPVGIAVGATALGVIVAGTAIYLTRRKRRRISFDPTQPTTINQLKNALPMTIISLPKPPPPSTNEQYYDPEQAARPANFHENVHLPKQPSQPDLDKLRTKFVPINNRLSYDKAKMASIGSQVPHGFQQSASSRQLIHPFMSRRNTLPPATTEFDLNYIAPPPPPPPEDEPRVAFNALPPRQNYPPPPVE